jgi:diguanylate cyclase (GGDEF)-like protein
MKKELSVFKSTILLYIIVLLLPFGFYFVSNSFDTIQQDTRIIAKINQISTGINQIPLDMTNSQTPSTIKKIDRDMDELTVWVNSNKNSQFYMGPKTLEDDFKELKVCWDSCKQLYLSNNQEKLIKTIIQNNRLIKNFSTVLEKMIYLKENKIINIFYISLMIVMILMLLSIYSIRTYIEYQLNKNSIYDKETNLYNHHYFEEHLKTTCARATRYKYPLSILSIAILGVDKTRVHDKEYKILMEVLGDILLSLTRTSDVACRYDDYHLAVILPFTEEKNAQILKSRIEERLKKQDFNISILATFKLSIVQYDSKETPKEYIARATEVLESL